MHDIFISYSRKDKEIVKVLCDALHENNISFWLDRNDIPLAAEFPAEIVNAIEHAKIVVLVASKNSKESDFVVREIKYALDKGKTVLPFKVDDEAYNDNLKLYLDIYNFFPAFPPPISIYLKEFVQKITALTQSDYFNIKPELKRITDINDPDLEILLTIYKNRFPSDKNVSQEFIIDNLLMGDETHKHFLFVLRKSNRIIGIADVSYFLKERRLFISYIATYNVKQKGDELIQSINIFEGLLDYFNNANMVIDEILFETEELRTFRFFSRLVKHKFQKNAYRVCINYLQPKMLADSDVGITNEIPCTLGYIPLNLTHDITSLSKTKVIELIEFINSNIYHDITDSSIEEHEMYLNKLLDHYKSTMGENVDLMQY